MNAKNKQLIALTALTTLAATAAALTAVYLITKKKRDKRLAVVSNAGYEMAYDVHYPMKYKKRS
jgi:hypothetical protein